MSVWLADTSIYHQQILSELTIPDELVSVVTCGRYQYELVSIIFGITFINCTYTLQILYLL